MATRTSHFSSGAPAPGGRGDPPGAGAAFTLIELLIVVAIIAILAAIAVPNFLEAQTRAKVSRVKADMRALATAIESYVVDNNVPPFRESLDLVIKPEVPKVSTRLEQMSSITTPIAYITSLPVDPFESFIPAPNNIIDYWDPTQFMYLVNRRYQPLNNPLRITIDDCIYLLVSPGPDGYMGPVSLSQGWPMDQALATRGTVYIIYDPTNGTLSPGNIYSNGTRGPQGAADYLIEMVTR